MASINPFEEIDKRLQGIEDTLREIADKPDPVPPPAERYLTTEEVCELLKVSRVTLWNWEKSGIIKSFRVGNLKRFKLSTIEAMAKQ